jgi:hypothetical protein
MPKYNSRFKLTPMPSSNRWRKIYRGRIHYVGIGHCIGKQDRAGYKVALDEWQSLKQFLDDTPTDDDMATYKAWKQPDPMTWEEVADMRLVP